MREQGPPISLLLWGGGVTLLPKAAPMPNTSHVFLTASNYRVSQLLKQAGGWERRVLEGEGQKPSYHMLLGASYSQGWVLLGGLETERKCPGRI